MDVRYIRRQHVDGSYDTTWNSDQINMIDTLLCRIDELQDELDQVRNIAEPKNVAEMVGWDNE
jgi:hypothetical protein